MADDPRAGELTTTNYHWTKPTVGASDDAWGGYLNQPISISIDSIVHGIDTRVIPPGGAIVSDTPPASPTPGMLWFDSVGGQTYVWYSDPNTSQWVLAVSATQGPQGTAQGPAGPNTLPMGVTDGSNAAAGQIGEVISANHFDWCVADDRRHSQCREYFVNGGRLGCLRRGMDYCEYQAATAMSGGLLRSAQ